MLLHKSLELFSPSLSISLSPALPIARHFLYWKRVFCFLFYFVMQQDFPSHNHGTSGQPVQIPRQAPEELCPADASSNVQVHPSLDVHRLRKFPRKPQDYFGIAVFPQQSNERSELSPRPLWQPEAAAASRRLEQSEPSFLLRLEQPQHYSGTASYAQKQQLKQQLSASHVQMEESLSEALHRSQERSIDLEQPLEQSDPLERLVDLPSRESALQATELQEGFDVQTTSTELPHNQEYRVQHFQLGYVPNGFALEQAYTQDLHRMTAAQHFPFHQSSQQVYPVPLAAHSAAVGDKQIFMYTLDKFLSALGTRLTLPKLGGQELDLHSLYKEVTARGGVEQVIRHSRWREIILALDILLTYPSASFVLRKHYINLLYHYEQAYYFGNQGQLLPPPAPLPAPNSVQFADYDGSPFDFPAKTKPVLKKRKRPAQVFGVDPAAFIGNIVTGAINAKAEEGYLVTVVAGSERLTGVLYHVPADSNVSQFARVPGLLDGVGSEFQVPGLVVQLQSKKKYSNYKKDPDAPRTIRTGYNIFVKEHRARLKQMHPEKEKEINRIVTEMWNRLPEGEKSLYVQRGQQDRERYRKEMLEYEEKLKLQSQAGEGNNAGQLFVENELGAYDGSLDYHVSLEAEGDMNSFQGLQPQVAAAGVASSSLSFSEQGYHLGKDGLGYHVFQPPVPESDSSGGHVETEEVYDIQEDDCEYPEDPPSEEGDPASEQAYPADEDERAYHATGQVYHVQEDEGGYSDSAQVYGMQEGESGYSQFSEREVQESDVQGCSGSSEQLHYVQKHVYSHSPQLRQQQVPASEASTGLASSNEMAYEVQGNGQTYNSQLPQSQQEVLGGSVPEQIYTRDGYVYAHIRQTPVVESAEALGVPILSEQAYHRQEGFSYSAHLPHQSQAPSGGQVAPDQVYQDRYPYPFHLSYTQAYSLPLIHAHPVRFPHPHPYFMHLPEAQALQYGHAFASYLHQPQAPAPEVAGPTPSHVYQVQDGGHTYNVQEDGQTMPIYKDGTYD